MRDYTYCDTDCRDCRCKEAVPDSCNTRCRSCKWIEECPCCNKKVRKELQERVLDAGSVEQPGQDEDVIEVKLSQISQTAPWQQRPIPKPLIEQMAESFQERGQLCPIVVRPRPRAKYSLYQPLNGFLRIKAAEYDGWTDLRALVKDMDDCQAAVEYLNVNLAERKMPWEEVALGILTVQNALTRKIGHPCDSRELASVMGRSKDWINDHKRALRVIQAHGIPIGTISHHKLLRNLGHGIPFDIEETILQGIINEGWTIERVYEEVERRVKLVCPPMLERHNGLTLSEANTPTGLIPGGGDSPALSSGSHSYNVVPGYAAIAAAGRPL